MFGRHVNDVLPDDMRQRLLPLIPGLLATVDDGADETRGYLALDWLVRTWLPAWLDLVPECLPDADRLRGLGHITGLVSAVAAGLVVRSAQRNAAAAGATAGCAAWDAFKCVKWGPAATESWAEPRAAARAAVGTAGWDAAWDAALAGAETAVGAAGGALIWNAAQAAASAAAWSTAGAARDVAPRDAAQAALAHTVSVLQESATGLFAYMITPAAEARPKWRDGTGFAAGLEAVETVEVIRQPPLAQGGAAPAETPSLCASARRAP
jgi:hypothetical protein